MPAPALIFGPYYGGDIVNPLLEPNGMRDWHGNRTKRATDLTDQIWAVSVSANPEHSGLIDMAFEATHGPYGGYSPNIEGVYDVEYWDYDFDTEERRLQRIELTKPSDTWWISNDGKGIFPVVGSDYVGNYFTIEQIAKTSDGTLKRYIDISSPWNHGYLKEDMSVIGKSKVEENFEMLNLPKGTEDSINWWNIAEDRLFKPVKNYYLAGHTVERFGDLGHYYDEWTVNGILTGWIYDILQYHEVYDENLDYDLQIKMQNDGFESVLDWMELNIPDFERDLAPNPDEFIYIDQFIITNFVTLYYGPFWWDLF